MTLNWLNPYCQLFGYGSCQSIPMPDAVPFWGATIVAVFVIAVALMMMGSAGVLQRETSRR